MRPAANHLAEPMKHEERVNSARFSRRWSVGSNRLSGWHGACMGRDQRPNRLEKLCSTEECRLEGFCQAQFSPDGRQIVTAQPI